MSNFIIRRKGAGYKMEISEDEKLAINKKVSHYLAVGNPPDFIRRIGILTLEGEINYERAKEVFEMIKESEDVFVAAIEGMGMKIEKREEESGAEADSGIIVQPGF